MSDRIYNAIDHDFARRMRNWARWKDGAPIPTTGVDYINDRYRELVFPILPGEALDTDWALHAIAARESQAVQWFWMFEGASLRWYGRRRAVDGKTFETWVVHGHELLKAKLYAYAQAQRARYANMPV